VELPAESIDLSIVLVTWNGRALILPCLQSIYENVRRISYEVIVVVNGSNDGTQAEIKKQFPQTILVEKERNVGYTRGNNEGIRKARGRYVLLLNDDTLIPAMTLEKMIAYLDEHPDVASVGPQLIDEKGSKQNCIHNIPTVLTEFVPYFILQMLFPRSFPSKRVDYQEPVDVMALQGACMVLRREALQSVGLLDEGYFAYLEETDWFLRLQRAGSRAVLLPDVYVVHYLGSSTKKRFQGPARVEYRRSLHRFFRKHYNNTIYGAFSVVQWTKALWNVTFHFLFCFLTGFRRKKTLNRFRSYLYVLKWYLRGKPAVMGLSRLSIEHVPASDNVAPNTEVRSLSSPPPTSLDSAFFPD